MPSLMIATNEKTSQRDRGSSQHTCLQTFYCTIYDHLTTERSFVFLACGLAGKATGNQNFRGEADKEIQKSIKNSFSIRLLIGKHR